MKKSKNLPYLNNVFIFLFLLSLLSGSNKQSKSQIFNIPPRGSFAYLKDEKTNYVRPDYLDKFYISENGLFKFHYTLSGSNAIDATCTNSKGIPDWIYEAEIAINKGHHILIDSLGFDPPPSDGDEYDIYFLNLGNGNYGYTNFSNTPNVSTSRQYDYISYMRADNDFEGSYYQTTGINALKVTMVHEFFHMVQLGYNLNPNNYLSNMSFGDAFFFEWSSVFFEDYCYPEVNDYIYYSNYLSQYMDSPLWTYDGCFEYSMGIFLKYILEKYSVDILLTAWNKIKNNERAFYAIQDAIEKETDTDIKELYNEFCQKFYFSGSNYDENYAVSIDAQYFSNLKVNWGERFEVDTDLEISDMSISTLTTMPIEITFNNKQNFGVLKNSKFNKNFIGSYVLKTDDYYTLGTLDLDSDDFVSNCSVGDTLTFFITNRSLEESNDLNITIDFMLPTQLIAFGHIFPNPVDGRGRINLKISNIEYGAFVDLTLFNLLGKKIYHDSKFSTGLIQVDLDSEVQQPLASGIYFLKVKTDDNEKVKKFTIIK